MTTGPGREQARQYLTAIAATLTVEGIPCRLTPKGGTPTLTIEEPGGAPNPITVIIGPGTGPGFWIDCTCTWTPRTPARTGSRPMTGTTPAIPPGQPGRDDLTPRVFRALYADYDLHAIGSGIHVAVPRNTPWYAARSIAAIARQISQRDPAPAPPGTPPDPS